MREAIKRGGQGLSEKEEVTFDDSLEDEDYVAV